jgi:CHASE3 domain sensor protein
MMTAGGPSTGTSITSQPSGKSSPGGGNAMDDIIKRLDEQDRKLDAIYASAERTRKYLLWTLIITVAVIILPLIGLAFAIPSFLSIYTGNGL